jgi:hypothetical protein
VAETPDSILDDMKKVLQIEPDETAFDTDLVMHINTVFSVLTQLGIGPVEGFMITDASATWASYLGGDKRLNMVKTYMYARIRLFFDPPAGSYHLTNALKEQVAELESRINMIREGDAWVDPAPPKSDPDLVELVVIPVNDLIEGGV